LDRASPVCLLKPGVAIPILDFLTEKMRKLGDLFFNLSFVYPPDTTIHKSPDVDHTYPVLRLKIKVMPKYVIEREIPGAGKLTAEQLKAVSQTSCGVLSNMGPQIQWVHSYVTGDKIYCVYIAPSEEMVREHAKKGGFPANSINEVVTIIDPTTAE
jgi:hypothetical protein